MAEKKYRISEERLTQIIKEEWGKKLKTVQLKKKLKVINEQLEKLQEDDLEEVTAGGETSTTSPDGLNHDAKKWKPEFEKKGSHLLEDEGLEDDIPGDIGITNDVPAEIDVQVTDEPGIEGTEGNDSLENLDLDQLMSLVADKIQEKITDEVDAATGVGEEVGNEMPTDDIPTDDIDVTDVAANEEGGDTTDIEITQEQEGEPIVNKQEPKNAIPFDNGKEGVETTPEKSTDAGSLNEEGATKEGEVKEGTVKEEGAVKEGEAKEGEAKEGEAKEGAPLNENTKTDDTKLIITEGTKLFTEIERMKQLTGFSKKKLVD